MKSLESSLTTPKPIDQNQQKFLEHTNKFYIAGGLSLLFALSTIILKEPNLKFEGGVLVTMLTGLYQSILSEYERHKLHLTERSLLENPDIDHQS